MYEHRVPEFVTVKVQGIFVTCVHLPNLGEQVRITDLKRIWGEQEKKGLGKEVGAKHIFAGDFNSLTWEDEDEEGWAKIGKERAASNMKLDEAISLSERKQILAKAPWCFDKDKEGNWQRRSGEVELEKTTAELTNSLQALGIKDWGDTGKLLKYLEFKKLEEPKFDLTKLMEENGFKDSWKEAEKMGEFGQIGCHITSK